MAPATPLPTDWCPQIIMMTAYQPQQCIRHILEGLLRSARSFKHMEQARPTEFNEAAEHAAEVNGPKSDNGSSYNMLLHTTLLLLKIACLASSITVDPTATSTALTALWKTIRGLSNSIADYTHSSSNSNSTSRSSWATILSDPVYDAEEERHISALLAQLVMPVFRQTVKTDAAVADICCRLLLALMTNSSTCTCRTVAAQIVKRGQKSSTWAVTDDSTMIDCQLRVQHSHHLCCDCDSIVTDCMLRLFRLTNAHATLVYLQHAHHTAILNSK